MDGGGGDRLGVCRPSSPTATGAQPRPAHHRGRGAADPSAGSQSAVEVHHPRGAGARRARQRRLAPVRHRQHPPRRSADRRAGPQDRIGWRSAIGMAEKAYDIWRLIRLVNPVTAAAQEAREQITKHFMPTCATRWRSQLAGAYVREVGRAAIDLYGGRLRVTRRSPGRACQRLDAARPRRRRRDAPSRCASSSPAGGRRQVEPRQCAVARVRAVVDARRRHDATSRPTRWSSRA